MGMVYQQVIIHNLIIDAHAALIASMLGVFYSERAQHGKKKGAWILDKHNSLEIENCATS